MNEALVQTGIARARSMTGAGVAIERPTVAAVRAALAEVPDPEIPIVSVVDLGMVDDIEVSPERIRVALLPTFVGCPAVDLIRAAVEDRLRAFGLAVDVRFDLHVPWTSERITPDGRARLHAAGFAPPSPTRPGASVLMQLAEPVSCPVCGSRRTVLENAFGPTQCRAIYYCTACRQPFERFKTI